VTGKKHNQHKLGDSNLNVQEIINCH